MTLEAPGSAVGSEHQRAAQRDTGAAAGLAASLPDVPLGRQARPVLWWAALGAAAVANTGFTFIKTNLATGGGVRWRRARILEIGFQFERTGVSHKLCPRNLIQHANRLGRHEPRYHDITLITQLLDLRLG